MPRAAPDVAAMTVTDAITDTFADGRKRAARQQNPLGSPYDPNSLYSQLKTQLMATMAWNPDGTLMVGLTQMMKQPRESSGEAGSQVTWQQGMKLQRAAAQRVAVKVREGALMRRGVRVSRQAARFWWMVQQWMVSAVRIATTVRVRVMRKMKRRLQAKRMIAKNNKHSMSYIAALTAAFYTA